MARSLRLSRLARVVLLVCIWLGLLGAAFLCLTSWLADPASAQFQLPWWLLFGLFVVAQSTVLNVQIEREARSISLTEIPFVLGLAFATPLTFVVVRVVASLTTEATFRRQYQQPLKLLFNTCLAFAEASVGLLLFTAVAHGAAGAEPRGWLAATVAGTGASVLAGLSVAVVIGLVERTLNTSRLREVLTSAAPTAAATCSVGVVAVAAVAQDRLAAIPLTVCCAALLLAYRAYSALRERHLGLERIYRFTQAVTHTAEMHAVMERVLEHARELLHAERARLVFLGTDNHTAELVLGPDGMRTRDGTNQGDGSLDSLIDRVVGQKATLLLNRGARDPKVRSWLDQLGVHESIVVPLHGDAGVIGLLAVDDRRGEARTFGESDVRLLETVANHAAIALRNGQLIEQLRHDSDHDALTDLPNRKAFERELMRRLGSTSRRRMLVVGILDLDAFKDINDTLGHQQGDLLLRSLAGRFGSISDEETMVARFGGDEFAVLLDGPAGEDVAARASMLILAALNQPITLDGVEVDVTASLGLAVAPQHGDTAEVLLRRADMAMYSAKETGRASLVFDWPMEDSAPNKLAVVTRLRQAIDAEALQVHFQPKVCLTTGLVRGAEALLRWHDPQLGSISPAEFVPVAERSGLIRPLTEYVLSTAIAACAKWQPVAPSVGVAVNLSARYLTDDDLIATVDHLLRHARLDPSLLTLEITESSIMADPARVIGVLETLRSRGISISVDDFGTGYSSLSYLRRLPVNEVKVDRSFVMTMHEDRENAAIVRSIIELSRSLGLRVVAEGVETHEVWEQLRALRCDLAQGYLISAPVSVQEFQRWIAGSHRAFGVLAPFSAADSVAEHAEPLSRG
jgi:diguanylate cyclase (GGDEF)-like protein